MRAVWAFAALLLFAGPAPAQDGVPVPALSGRVVDPAGTLRPPQARALTDRLAAIESNRGTQIVVLIVPTTQPEDIASYAQRVAETWKVGRRDVGDGLVIVVAPRDRRVDIRVAKSLEGAVPDVLAGRIIDEQIRPAFRAGDYAGGLGAALDRLDAAIAGEALPAPTRTPAGRGRRGDRGLDLQDLAVFLFVAVPVVGGVLARAVGRKLGAVLTGAAVGGVAWWLTASLLVAAGAGLVALVLVGIVGLGTRSGGAAMVWGGGFGGGRGGGGFRSGGGGNFGGGGASGSW